MVEARAIPTRRTTPRLRRGAVRALATILSEECDEEAWARHIPADYRGERPGILHELPIRTIAGTTVGATLAACAPFGLAEIGDPRALDVFLRREDAFTALGEILTDEPA